MNEIEFLPTWITNQSKYCKVVCLLGNHDIPYLTKQLRHYSCQQIDVVEKIQSFFFKVKAKLSVIVDDYLVSHAGYCKGNELEAWHLQPVQKQHLVKLSQLERQVGKSRGGSVSFGSMV